MAPPSRDETNPLGPRRRVVVPTTIEVRSRRQALARCRRPLAGRLLAPPAPSGRPPRSPDASAARAASRRRRRLPSAARPQVRDAPNGSCSVLGISTRDRPGLLVDIVSVLKDVNVNVVSAEVRAQRRAGAAAAAGCLPPEPPSAAAPAPEPPAARPRLALPASPKPPARPAQVDTVGTQAKDEFFVTYHGEPLNSSMVQLVTNALQYYLSLAEVEKEESY
jgi:hypothetical protein